MKKTHVARLLGTLALALLFCVVSAAAHAEDGYRVIHRYPHDPNAFTQGLIYLNGHLYESDGLYGKSSLREVDLQTGRVIREIQLPSQYFGEGLTNWGNTLIQLTWKAHIGFVYNRSNFQLIRTFHYPWQGWGLTQDGKDLIESDGSSTLHFMNPDTFADVRDINVTWHGKPVKNLNELEYIHGKIYANVWMTNKIAIISPETGNVLEWINLSGLLPDIEVHGPNAVLNGIAYDPTGNRLFVTGKLWPRLFQIEVVKK